MNLEKKGPHGKRRTFDMRCFSLAIFKLSPKTYRFLRDMFNLPGGSILKEVLYSIPFETGFTSTVANKLKHDVPLLEALDTYVMMSCDEMALRKGLYYDEKRDLVHGFIDYGSGRTTGEVADHAPQFMINWLRSPLKQVVATYFTWNTCPTDVLKILIPENIACLRRLGIILKEITPVIKARLIAQLLGSLLKKAEVIHSLSLELKPLLLLILLTS